MAGSAFDVEQLRLAAARGLPASCHDDFLRLSRTLVHGPAFQWLLVDAPDENLRKQVMTALDEVLRMAGLSTSRLPLSDRIADAAMLEDRLIKNARAGAVVHVVGRPAGMVRFGAVGRFQRTPRTPCLASPRPPGVLARCRCDCTRLRQGA